MSGEPPSSPLPVSGLPVTGQTTQHGIKSAIKHRTCVSPSAHVLLVSSYLYPQPGMGILRVSSLWIPLVRCIFSVHFSYFFIHLRIPLISPMIPQALRLPLQQKKLSKGINWSRLQGSAWKTQTTLIVLPPPQPRILPPPPPSQIPPWPTLLPLTPLVTRWTRSKTPLQI